MTSAITSSATATTAAGGRRGDRSTTGGRKAAAGHLGQHARLGETGQIGLGEDRVQLGVRLGGGPLLRRPRERRGLALPNRRSYAALVAGRQQAALRGGHLVDELPRQLRPRADSERLQVDRLPVGGGPDHLAVILEPFDAQQTVVVGRLFLGRNSEPLIVGIERVRHGLSRGLSPAARPRSERGWTWPTR